MSIDAGDRQDYKDVYEDSGTRLMAEGTVNTFDIWVEDDYNDTSRVVHLDKQAASLFVGAIVNWLALS